MPKKRKTQIVFEENKDGVKVLTEKPIERNENFKARRSRKFCLISYIDRHALERFVISQEWIQHWAMCSHDRDIKEDGTVKGFHTHILLYTYDAKTSTAIRKIFDRYSAEVYQYEDVKPQNTLCQECHDMPYQWRYLIHKDNPERAQYEEIERICDDFSYWHKMETTLGMTASDTNSGLAMVEDILAGTSTREMCRRYGRNYIYHVPHLMNVAHNIAKEEFNGGQWDFKEVCSLLLDGTNKFSEEYKYIFFMILDYIKSECITQYNAKVDFYLNERIEEK